MIYDELNQTILNILRAENLRATLPRILILNILIEEDRELTAYEIEKIISLKNCKNIYISTIYNVLGSFEQSNIVHKFKAGDEQAYFSLKKNKKNSDDDIRTICIKCKKNISINDEKIDQNIHGLLNKKGFDFKSFSLVLNILCNDCR